MFNAKLVICHSWFHVVGFVCRDRNTLHMICHVDSLYLQWRYFSQRTLYVGSPRTHSLFPRPEESLLTLPYCACERLWGCDWGALVLSASLKNSLVIWMRWGKKCVLYVCECLNLRHAGCAVFSSRGVVRAFRESALFIDKSQHAQFLRKEHTDVNTRALRRSEMYITVGHHSLLSQITLIVTCNVV